MGGWGWRHLDGDAKRWASACITCPGGSGLASSPTTSHGPSVRPSVRCAASLDTWIKNNRSTIWTDHGVHGWSPIHVAFSGTVDVYQEGGDVSGPSFFFFFTNRHHDVGRTKLWLTLGWQTRLTARERGGEKKKRSVYFKLNIKLKKLNLNR